jgi:hypothetical protein
VVTGSALGMRSDEQVKASGSSWTMALEPCQPGRLPATSSDVELESESYILSDPTPFQKCQGFRSHSPVLSMSSARRSRRSASCQSLRSEPSTLMRFLSKPNRHLQLPSFETLGIATPSPNSISPTATKEILKKGSSALPETPCTSTSASTPTVRRSRTALNIPVPNPYSSPLPLTPPDDIDCVSWSPDSRVLGFPTDPIPAPKSAFHTEEFTTQPSHSNNQSDGSTMSLRQSTPLSGAIEDTVSVAGDNLQNDENAGSWLSASVAAAGSLNHPPPVFLRRERTASSFRVTS